MRGIEEKQPEIFSYTNTEEKIPENHPIRPFRELVNEILKGMDSSFDALYADCGRPSIAPEYLLRASILQILYTIRSERQLMEQINFNIMFRWFVGLNIDDQVWDHSTFTKNRERILGSEITQLFFAKVTELARKKKILSSEHFTVDGTLIEAWAGIKSFQEKEEENGENKTEPPRDGGGNAAVDFHGKKLTSRTHESKTDPQARLYKKSKGSEAKLVYMGHVLMENRNGLAVDVQVTLAGGTEEREAAEEMMQDQGGTKRLTLGADKGYSAKILTTVPCYSDYPAIFFMSTKNL
jgi:transposase